MAIVRIIISIAKYVAASVLKIEGQTISPGLPYYHLSTTVKCIHLHSGFLGTKGKNGPNIYCEVLRQSLFKYINVGNPEQGLSRHLGCLGEPDNGKNTLK